jgi:GGDEF domain-containing protein
MRTSERLYANVLVQLLAIFFMSLYLFFTYQLYPTNFIWFSAALLVGIFGLFRKIYVVLVAVFFIVLCYGAITIYNLYIAKTISGIGWNEMIWLVAFPFIGLMGGINIKEPLPKQKGWNYTRSGKDKEDKIDEAVLIDGFLEHGDFLKQLEEELYHGLRQKRKMALMLIEIHYFQELRREYGYEQTELFLQKVAEIINEIIPDSELKAYLNQGLFAVVLTGTELANASISEIRLDDEFNSMLLSRPRREGSVSARLRFAAFICPAQGMTAYEILEEAQHELSFIME